MDELVIEVERRETTGKGSARKLRQQGQIPAVVYGGGKEPVPVSVDRHAITELFRQEKGRNTVFLLKMKGTKQQRHALVVDEQRDPVSGRFVHLDFIRVMKGQRVKVDIPVVIEGEAEGVKVGGFLDWVSRSLSIECEAEAIPEAFVVDVSDVKLGDHLVAGSLPLPNGVELLDDPGKVIVTIEKHGIKLTEEEEAEEAAELAAAKEEEGAEPEVIRRGKATDENEE